MAEKLTGQDISFLTLPTAVFCVECELISKNNTPCCLACGSRALLSLSRVLGGSLRGQQTAHLIADAELDRLVRELLRTVPAPTAENRIPASFATLAPSRSHARGMCAQPAQSMGHVFGSEPNLQPGEIDLEPAISVIAERAQTLTGATGAAIALRHGDEIVCRARTGRTAPDLGVRLQTDSGISADCVRTGEIVLCHDAERNPCVDLASCRRLGARSILAAPLRHFRRTLGVFEVLSGAPHAFDNRDVATMQLLSSLMVAAISRLSSLRGQ
jgi:GAF domain-containing protein